MTARDDNAARRRRLKFDEGVAEHIAPILQRLGFNSTEITPYAVKFESPNVEVIISHDLLSYEIELSFCRKADRSVRFQLCDMLEAGLGKDPKICGLLQASNPVRVQQLLEDVADFLRRYGQAVLAGDPAVYQLMADVSSVRNERVTKAIVQSPIRNAAQEAWRRHDYAKVRMLYESIGPNLTPVERKRLEYVRDRSS